MVARLERNVFDALEQSELTLDLACRIYHDVEQSAQAFDGLVDKMQDFDLDDAAFDLADKLEDILAKLSIASANKVRILQGLEPYERIPGSDD